MQNLMAVRPTTYGYRRLHAMLRDQGIHANVKTIWKLMSKKGWLSSSRQRTERPGRRHDGQVAVPIPNQRWASDFTEIQAWNGERLKLAIIIDCADRMILSWSLKKRMMAEDIGEMLKEAIFARFGQDRTKAKDIEFLSDNGSIYLSDQFRQTLKLFGMIACRTPIRSPESNGIAEAFFGTLKRDYVYQSCLETSQDVERQAAGWIKDYNEVAPQSALNMISPVKYHSNWISQNGKSAV